MLSEERHPASEIAAEVVKGKADEGATAGGGWNPLEISGIFAEPKWMTRVSAWLSHIPFAFALVEMVRPKVLVELGTHAGDSYFAFCQGMVESRVTGKCFAVDTWKGDAQAGFYGEEVFKELREYDNEMYGGFSKLMRMYFAEARKEFAAKSVDVLHIDGEHTYAAVKRDYEMWVDTVADGGVVLFHDTTERAPGFGVIDLWEELRRKHSGFEFLHGHGLGVLFPRGVPAGMEKFLAAATERPEAVRGLFEGLGLRIEAERDLMNAREDAARGGGRG